jgi:hypothetical protein
MASIGSRCKTLKGGAFFLRTVVGVLSAISAFVAGRRAAKWAK